MKWAAPALVLIALLLPPSALASQVSSASGASTYDASSPQAPAVRDLNPAPGTTLRTFFPQFSASIDTHGAPLRRESLRLYVDGNDVTESAAIGPSGVSYMPHEHLSAGWHDAFVEGSDTANRTFSDGWVFQTQNPDVQEPVNDGSFAFASAGAGPHAQGRFMHFFIVAPFQGIGLLQLCGFEFPFLRAGLTPVLFVTVPFGFNNALFACNAGVLFTPIAFAPISPVFFPFGIAGPNFFNSNGNRHRPRPWTAPGSGTYSNAPVTMPAQGISPSAAIPGQVYRGTGATTLPRARMPIAAPHGVVMPVIPHPAIPHPSIPH